MESLENLQERKSKITKDIKQLQIWSNVLNNGKIPYLCIKFGDEEYFIPQELVNVQKITGGAISKTNSAISRKKKELAIVNIEIKWYEQNKPLFNRIKLTEYDGIRS